ncbi:hypothetical protein GOBAR_DD00447 [Gossypium barbadense]|nr:hypothetical protein GOBAR_DD00447 [Gossypium barbadense]
MWVAVGQSMVAVPGHDSRSSPSFDVPSVVQVMAPLSIPKARSLECILDGLPLIDSNFLQDLSACCTTTQR